METIDIMKEQAAPGLLTRQSLFENRSRRGKEADLEAELSPNSPPLHLGGYKRQTFQTGSQP